MSDSGLRRIAWSLAVYTVIVLIVSAIWLFSAADYSNVSWLEIQVRTITGLGAPVLGLIIIRRQPHQRLGWLWLIIGFFSCFRSLGLSIFYGSGSQFAGYSALEYFLLWFTETTNLFVLVGQVLLLLWFPDGRLVSRRWRFFYLPLLAATAGLFLMLFVTGQNWNGEGAGGIVIINPYGWLPANLTAIIAPPAFLTLVLSMTLAAVSLIFRYRSAGQRVRYQIRWFVLGGFLFVFMNFAPLGNQSNPDALTNSNRLLYIIAFSNSIPLYLAVGFAMLRYRLYDIDIIIRKTLQYTLLTGLLALVYFGSVVLLQNLTENLLGEQSPLVIVLSTLAIAALFNPMRARIQEFIDRRFYRKKYDAEQALAQFAATARDEVDMDKLTAALLGVVEETIQPESLGLWLKLEENKRS